MAASIIQAPKTLYEVFRKFTLSFKNNDSYSVDYMYTVHAARCGVFSIEPRDDQGSMELGNFCDSRNMRARLWRGAPGAELEHILTEMNVAGLSNLIKTST
uniref:Uncharacterized protein n=1 Tax=Coccidioides posadasii RMSCC 3488 TaxID=454284 RepID=A0A0J6F929_COCPO|nr:hypothetical protein CPAG_01820 [Coccidioides posadasii RMSCC 3488]